MRPIATMVLASAVCIFASLCARASVAEDLEAEIKRSISELKERAKAQNDHDRERRTNQAREEVNRVSSQIEASAPRPVNDTASKVLVYMRSKSGVGFPTPEQVVVAPVPTRTYDLSYIAKLRGKTSPPERAPQRPVRCADSTTKKIERFSNGDDSKITWDILYLPEDMVPLDSSEVYGIKTQLYPFGPNSNDSVYRRMETDSVPCLPYRIRRTERFEFYDRGNNALRNYDKKPTSPGELHPWVQERILKKGGR